MLDKNECKYIEKIIDLTNKDKIEWTKFDDGIFRSKEIYYKIPKRSKENYQMEFIVVSNKFELIIEDIYTAKQRNVLKSTLWGKKDKDPSNNYYKINEFKIVSEDDQTIEYKMIHRLYINIKYKLDKEAEELKNENINDFLNASF